MKRNEDEPEVQQTPREDDVAGLIRRAGRRPEISAEDLAAGRKVARAAWEEAVAGERARRWRRRGFYAIAASLLLVLLAGGWWMVSRPRGHLVVVATVEMSSGPIAAIDVAQDRPLEIGIGAALSNGVALSTGPASEDSPVLLALRMAGGQSVRLHAGTKLRLLSESRLELLRGAVYVDSGPAVSERAELEIVTPLGVVREIGTQYEVHLGEGSETVRVRVREGRVSVSRNGESHDAGRGEELTVDSDGSVARRALRPDAPEWGWALAAAPAMEIEGRTLDAFLDWVARETGREVRYADEALARSAETIRLHGTIEGLRPDESLRMILQGSGLDHRGEEDGSILVVRTRR